MATKKRSLKKLATETAEEFALFVGFAASNKTSFAAYAKFVGKLAADLSAIAERNNWAKRTKRGDLVQTLNDIAQSQDAKTEAAIGARRERLSILAGIKKLSELEIKKIVKLSEDRPDKPIMGGADLTKLIKAYVEMSRAEHGEAGLIVQAKGSLDGVTLLPKSALYNPPDDDEE